MDTGRRVGRRAGAGGLFAASLCGLALAACGGSTSPKVDPRTLLQEAKAKVDSSSAVHFTLTSSNVSSSGTNITAGEGDLVRPDALQGSFTIKLNGFGATVKVASKGAVFEALLPFQTHYSRTNPANYGLTNPALLIDPNRGLTSLLAQAQNPRAGSTIRVNGELLDQVDFAVPGSSLPVLPDANPSQPVTLTAAINPKTQEVRQITIVGPLTSASNSTYIVTLTKYNEQVSITLPPTS